MNILLFYLGLYFFIFVLKLVWTILMAIFKPPKVEPLKISKDYVDSISLWLESYGFAFPPVRRRERKAERIIRVIYQEFAPAIQNDKQFFYYYIREAAIRPALLDAIYVARNSEQYQKNLQAIYFWYKRKGLQKIEYWNPFKRGNPNNLETYNQLLIQYLFEIFKVPNGVHSVWNRWYREETLIYELSKQEGGDDLAKNPLFLLYFHLTEGRSLRKLEGTGIQVRFSRMLAYYFLRSKGSTFKEAFWEAVVNTEDMDEGLTWTICRKDLSLKEVDFWRSFFRFLAKEGVEVDQAALVSDVMDKLRLIRFGKGILSEQEVYQEFAWTATDFSFKGRTWNSLNQYLLRMIDIRYPLPAGMREVYNFTRNNGNKYQIVRLKSRQALIEEGRNMRHCIGSEEEYHIDCLSGKFTAWSMRQVLEEERYDRILTIFMKGFEVLECSGFNDMDSTEEAYELLDTWVKKLTKAPKKYEVLENV